MRTYNPKLARAPLTIYMGARALGTGLWTGTRTNLRAWEGQASQHNLYGDPLRRCFLLERSSIIRTPNPRPSSTLLLAAGEFAMWAAPPQASQGPPKTSPAAGGILRWCTLGLEPWIGVVEAWLASLYRWTLKLLRPARFRP